MNWSPNHAKLTCGRSLGEWIWSGYEPTGFIHPLWQVMSILKQHQIHANDLKQVVPIIGKLAT